MSRASEIADIGVGLGVLGLTIGFFAKIGKGVKKVSNGTKKSIWGL